MTERPAEDDPTATRPFGSPGADTGSAPLDFRAQLQDLARPGGLDSLDSTPNLSAGETAGDFPAIPGYRIHRKIGRGGMGVVYEAFDERLKVLVALKVLPDRLDEDDEGRDGRHAAARERFASEAAILAQFDHPNIVRVYAAGEANGWLYFAMRLLSNGALHRHLIAARTSAANVARLLAKIARAVQHLHDKGVWHRDLKPHNILIGDGGEPQVADFGVAKWADGRATVGFVRLGTYSYMAPEMIALGSAGCGPAVDVWALGVMLSELLAGERPFVGGTEAELLDRIAHAAPPPFSESATVCPGTDDRLEAIALRALAKDPARRYPTAAAMADDLELWLGQEPGGVSSAPLAELRRNAAVVSDDATKTIPLPIRRRRWLAIATVAVLAATVLVAVLVWARNPEPEPTPEPSLTLSQLLERNGEVLVVDDKGNARFPLAEVSGSQGGMKSGQNGYFAVTGSPVMMAEISSTAPPFPFSIEADVRHEFGLAGASLVGVYGGRRSHTVPGAAGAKVPQLPEHLFYALSLDTCWTLEKPTPPGVAVAGGVRFDPNERNEVDYLPVSQFKPKMPPIRHLPHKDGAEPEFLHLILKVYPGEFQPMLQREGFRGNTVDDLKGKFGGVFFRAGRPIPTPLLGDGYGLLAKEGTAAFRNVRVRKITP